MAPEKRNSLLQWSGFIVTAVGILVAVSMYVGRLESKVMDVEESNAQQWRAINGIKSSMQYIDAGVQEMRINMRRDMEDRGIRYIERDVPQGRAGAQ
jgi:hypothetical protein